MPKKVTRDEYVQRLNTIHQHQYDYTLLPNDLSTSTRISVGCRVHGVFTPTLSAHLQGSGCPFCNWDNKKEKTQQKLIAKATTAHNGAYDYSKTMYLDKDTPVTITCKKHGDFSMRLWNHVYGPDKCPLCGSGKKRTTNDFITLAKEVHGDTYDYSQVSYINATTKVSIVCRSHGVFEQTPDMHCFSDTQGCPRCKASSGEREVYKHLKALGVSNFVCEQTFVGCVAPDTGVLLRYDFYLPSHNLLIEYDGEAHFHQINFSGALTSDDMQARLTRTQLLDGIKNQYAKQHNIKLIRIPYTAFGDIRSIIVDAIKDL